MSAWFSDINNPDKIELGKISTQDPTYETLKDWFNATQSSGLLCGGSFIDNEDGSITVATGCGIVKTVSNILGNTIFVDWPENTNVTLVDNSMNYPYVDYNGGNPVINSTDDFDAVDFTTQFIIGLIYREGTDLHILEAGSRRFDFAHRILIQDFEVHGFQRTDGLIISETGMRNIAVSTGSFYYISDKHTLEDFDTSGSDLFTYYYSDGDSGWTEVPDQSQIDNIYYDDGDGTLAEIGNNRYGIHWVYQGFDGDMHVLYGQGSYKLAEANDVQPPLILPVKLSAFSFIVGKVIIFKNAAIFAELHSAFDIVFAPSVLIPHNDTTAIQGGSADEYYHLTSAQHAKLIAYVTAVGADAILDFNDARYSRAFNMIGVAADTSFGVGVCSPESVPSGMIGLPGHDIIGHDNHGNYQYSDGSIMVYVPKFYYIIGTGANGFAVNVIDIKGIDTYATTAAANAAGYALHRAFIDGGSEQNGFFIDKYMCSKNALGTGYVGSSIKDGLPIACSSLHNSIDELTACSTNHSYQTINAAHARDGVDGAVNSNSIFFCSSKFIYSALAILSMAHGQAATSTTNCAWYSAGTTNYPKGCNDDALGDTDDGTILYVTDGYSNCGKTGSGTPFAKTTHNGQNCGIADLNGLMYEVTLGASTIAPGHSIEDMTRANPCKVTETGHGRSTGDYVTLVYITQSDWTALNGKVYKITVVDASNFTLDSVDSSGFTLAYDSGPDPGVIRMGDFYIAKESTSMKDFTSGDSVATDHWGATGIAAMMDEFTPVFETSYPNNGYSQNIGNGANQVLGEAISGNEYSLTGLGIPKDSNGISSTGTNLFGQDLFYQDFNDEGLLMSCSEWSGGNVCGIWAISLYSYRTRISATYGYRVGTYPV